MIDIRNLTNSSGSAERQPAWSPDGQWLLQRAIQSKSSAPEQAVALPHEVPVYLTYITAVATDRGVAFRNDVYGRDG